MKRPLSEWEKIFTNDIIKKGLISKILNSSYNSTTANKKMGRRPKHFFKEDIQMAKKHMKHMFNITIRKMQVKIAMKYHLMVVRMPSLKVYK